MTGALLAMEIGTHLRPRAFGPLVRHLPLAQHGRGRHRPEPWLQRRAPRVSRGRPQRDEVLSGAWNNNTTILEKEDYAYLLCVLGGTTNTECTTPAVAGSATGVAALSTAFAVTGHTDGTLDGTEAQESFVAAGASRDAVPSQAASTSSSSAAATTRILQTTGRARRFRGHDPRASERRARPRRAPARSGRSRSSPASTSQPRSSSSGRARPAAGSSCGRR